MTTSDPSVRPTVLVVDDEEQAREIMQTHLAGAGYQVRLARDAKEALAQLMASPPDLLVVDVVMPSMTGWELLNLIRSYVRFSRLPVLMVSAVREDMQGCDRLTRFIGKPLDSSRFLQVAGELLASA